MNETATTTPSQGAGRSTWLAGGVVAIALIIVALAIVFVDGRRPEATYPSDSPEAAFQAYVRAWESGDTDAAWALLSVSAQGRTSLERFRSAGLRRSGEPWRAWIDGTTIEADRAVLRLSIETLAGDGLLGPDRERRTSRMTLINEHDRWAIDTPTIVYDW